MSAYVTVVCDTCGDEYSDTFPTASAVRAVREMGWQVGKGYRATCFECVWERENGGES